MSDAPRRESGRDGSQSPGADSETSIVAALHRLLDRLQGDEGILIVAEAVVITQRHRVIGHAAMVAETLVPYEPLLVRCGAGARPIRKGMHLRVWRDAGGVYLQHCIP